MTRKGIANDPERKTRIAQAALDLIAEGGIKAATHRTIAAAARVPLGSVTYYYASMDHILVEAFALFGDQLDPRYGIAITAAPTQMEARAVLVDAICGKRRATQRELRLFREMYAYGSTSPRVQDLVRSFEARSIAALSVHFAEPAARAIDALVEGWWIYQSWTPGGLDPQMVRHAIDALADKFSTSSPTVLSEPAQNQPTQRTISVPGVHGHSENKERQRPNPIPH